MGSLELGRYDTTGGRTSCGEDSLCTLEHLTNQPPASWYLDPARKGKFAYQR